MCKRVYKSAEAQDRLYLFSSFRESKCLSGWLKVSEQRFNFQPPPNQDHMSTLSGVQILWRPVHVTDFKDVAKCNTSQTGHRFPVKHCDCVERTCCYTGWLCWAIRTGCSCQSFETNDIFSLCNLSFPFKTN